MLKGAIKINTKLYSVRHGRKPGIYKTFEEVEEQVEGYLNAEYKECVSISEAIEFLSEEPNDVNYLRAKDNYKNKTVVYIESNMTVDNLCYGILICNERGIVSKNSICLNIELLKSKNKLAIELLGINKALEIVKDLNISDVIITYNSEVVNMLLSNAVDISTEAIYKYLKSIEAFKENINIDFEHINNYATFNQNKLNVEMLSKLAYAL